MSCMHLLTERDFKDNYFISHPRVLCCRTCQNNIYENAKNNFVLRKVFKRPQIKGIIKYTPQQKIELLRKNKSQNLIP